MCLSLFWGEQEWIKGKFQTKVLGLVKTIMESRNRRVRGPAHGPICYINNRVFRKGIFAPAFLLLDFCSCMFNVEKNLQSILS